MSYQNYKLRCLRLESIFTLSCVLTWQSEVRGLNIPKFTLVNLSLWAMVERKLKLFMNVYAYIFIL